jgi:hypothetical protein
MLISSSLQPPLASTTTDSNPPIPNFEFQHPTGNGDIQKGCSITQEARVQEARIQEAPRYSQEARYQFRSVHSKAQHRQGAREIMRSRRPSLHEFAILSPFFRHSFAILSPFFRHSFAILSPFFRHSFARRSSRLESLSTTNAPSARRIWGYPGLITSRAARLSAAPRFT